MTFDEAIGRPAAAGRRLLTLDAALEALARVNPRQAAMVESRFFGGLDVAETAALLEVSEATVQRDWRAAKAWLGRSCGARGLSAGLRPAELRRNAMDSDAWERLQALFHAAADRPTERGRVPDARPCGGDAALVAE